MPAFGPAVQLLGAGTMQRLSEPILGNLFLSGGRVELHSKLVRQRTKDRDNDRAHEDAQRSKCARRS